MNSVFSAGSGFNIATPSVYTQSSTLSPVNSRLNKVPIMDLSICRHPNEVKLVILKIVF